MLAAALVCVPAHAQDPARTDPMSPRMVRLEDLPPPIRLGARAEAIRRGVHVVPVVVVVSDAASYVEAIARWTPQRRYPVLWDNGSASACEDIARFVRGFKPMKVLRYSAANEAAVHRARGEAADTPPWPESAVEQRTMIEEAVARSWGASSPGGLPAALGRLGLTPPGVVAADVNDPAWPAAAALAAGHAQPIVWASVPDRLGEALDVTRADELAAAIESACDATGLPWRDAGDAIDAVTIALNAPVKVAVGAESLIALTDYIGRRVAGGSRTRETGTRWAWAGQVPGDEARSAYRAMCALFLVPASAWIFDGYPSSDPWRAYDGTVADRTLQHAGFETTLDDEPRQGRPDWLRRASRPVTAGLVLVNTKGMEDFFELLPGECRPGETPILGVPAVVHMVHSWSAAWPDNRETVAGCWLERGAYAYAGSVQEPFLSAFVPTPIVAARLVSLYPWGAAVRSDAGPAWRIAVLGDPLMSVGPAAPREDVLPPLEGTEDVGASSALAVKEERFAEALRTLTMLGRDEDAARLAAALMRDKPRAVTPEFARAAVMPLFRVGRADDLVRAFEHMPAGDGFEPWLLDALWLIGAPRVEGEADERLVGMLRTHIRPDQPGRDAATIAPAIALLYGRGSAAALLAEARAKSIRAPDLRALDEAERRLGGR